MRTGIFSSTEGESGYRPLPLATARADVCQGAEKGSHRLEVLAKPDVLTNIFKKLREKRAPP
ncbi:hypothetical protein P3T43_002713 [Paraburkholderia sp. GAS41]